MKAEHMVRVALVRCPATYLTYYRWPALGPSYLAALLEARGTEVRIFDALFNGWSAAELVERIRSYAPTLVGFTAMTHEVKAAGEIAAALKATMPCKVVVGGPHVTALPERTLQELPSFDYGICQEGETVLPRLVDLVSGEKGEAPESIPGLVYRQGAGEIRCNPSAPFLTSAELDGLPFPAFHQYYGGNPKALADPNDSYVIMTSRGCPFSCAFCMRVLGKHVRRRSAENVVREIEQAVRRYGARRIHFSDEIFLADTPQTRQALQLMIQSGLHRRIQWRACTRANFVTEELIALARESGCFSLHMGVESGNDEILKNTNKGLTVARIRDAVAIIKKFKIPLQTYYILGHPGETRETIEDTKNLAVELNTDEIAVGLMVPYPGTRIYEMAHRGEMGYRLLTEDWPDYDKYGGRALEIEGLPHEYLERQQRNVFLSLYLRNYRFLDAMKFFLTYRTGIAYIIKKQIGRLLGKGNTRPG